MHKKNLKTQANDSPSHLTIKDLPTEFVELSDEALSQVCGGINVNLSQFIFNGMVMLGGGGGGAIVPFQYLSSSNTVDPAMIDPEFYQNGVF
jgi:hypothetical protein